MARKRMIDPAIWSDSDLGECTRDARLLVIGMMSLADDEGRIEANTRYLRKEIFGYDDDVTTEVVAALLDEITDHFRNLRFYEVEGRCYAVFLNWERYQKIEKPYRSRLPDPPDYQPPAGKLREWSTTNPQRPDGSVGRDDNHSPNVPRTIVERSPQEKKEKKKEENNTPSVERATARRPQQASPEISPALKPDPTTQHPAVKAFKEFHRLSSYPSLEARTAIAETVNDLDLWEITMRNWVISANRPTNVKGQLDWYKRGGQQYPDRPGRANAPPSDTAIPNTNEYTTHAEMQERVAEFAKTYKKRIPGESSP